MKLLSRPPFQHVRCDRWNGIYGDLWLVVRPSVLGSTRKTILYSPTTGRFLWTDPQATTYKDQTDSFSLMLFANSIRAIDIGTLKQLATDPNSTEILVAVTKILMHYDIAHVPILNNTQDNMLQTTMDIEGLDLQAIEAKNADQVGYVNPDLGDKLKYYLATVKLRTKADSLEVREYHAIVLPATNNILLQRIELDTAIPQDIPIDDCMFLCSPDVLRANSKKADVDSTLEGWRFLEMQYNTKSEQARSDYGKYST